MDEMSQKNLSTKQQQQKKEAVQEDRIKDRVYSPGLSPELQVLFKDGLDKYLSWKA